jgi:hypothetical protein
MENSWTFDYISDQILINQSDQEKDGLVYELCIKSAAIIHLASLPITMSSEEKRRTRANVDLLKTNTDSASSKTEQRIGW